MFAECQDQALGKAAMWRHPGPALCRVSASGTRQSDGPGWRHVAALPSAKALSKVSAECPKSDTRQRTLCRGRLCRVAFAECYTRQRVCRVQISLLPSVTGTRQSQWIRSCINLAWSSSISRKSTVRLARLYNGSVIHSLRWYVNHTRKQEQLIFPTNMDEILGCISSPFI